MKSIKITTIKRKAAQLITEASFSLPPDIVYALEDARSAESSPRAKKILGYILENAETARKEKLPLCQDCGTVYISLDIGPGICIEEAHSLEAGLNEAVSEVYQKAYLRKSIVSDPLFRRKNTGSNTPASVETSFGPGRGIEISITLKGGGSENCSYLFMLNPSAGESELTELVRDVVQENVTKCCPPVIIGVGIGSTASGVVGLARKASFRRLDRRNGSRRYRELEEKMLGEVNRLGIGPQGLGGSTTALACNIEFAPCHMATLPVAVFLGCHSMRRACSKISPS
ncbi:MAG: fumarate hydratase [Actinomycetota bacterium]